MTDTASHERIDWARMCKEIRARNEWLQKELAKAVGSATWVTVSRWENGHHAPSDAHQEKLLEIFAGPQKQLDQT